MKDRCRCFKIDQNRLFLGILLYVMLYIYLFLSEIEQCNSKPPCSFIKIHLHFFQTPVFQLPFRHFRVCAPEVLKGSVSLDPALNPSPHRPDRRLHPLAVQSNLPFICLLRSSPIRLHLLSTHLRGQSNIKQKCVSDKISKRLALSFNTPASARTLLLPL